MRAFVRRSKRDLPEGLPAETSRWDVLMREYEMLREDERNNISVMVAMSSVVALVAGTSVFFLLRSCGLTTTTSCARYPWQAYAFLPAPTVAITALLVQLATVATIRGRLMLALERSLVAERHVEYRVGDQPIAAMSAYHMQAPFFHGARGTALYIIMFSLPFVVMIGLIYYAGLQLPVEGPWIFYSAYTFILSLQAWGGSVTLRGYPHVDTWIAKRVAKERKRGTIEV